MPFEAEKGFAKMFQKKLIALRTEYLTELYLLKKYPDYKVSLTSNPTDVRVKQLEARGRKVRKTILLKDALKLTREYINKKIIERRTSKKRSFKPTSLVNPKRKRPR